MSSDPWQLINAAANTSKPRSFSRATLDALSDELWAVATCAEAECP